MGILALRAGFSERDQFLALKLFFDFIINYMLDQKKECKRMVSELLEYTSTRVCFYMFFHTVFFDSMLVFAICYAVHVTESLYLFIFFNVYVTFYMS